MSIDRGDLIWIDLDPRTGHEQAGHRPAIVLSPKHYNTRSGLALICPITSRSKGYPFEVALPDDLPLQGVVLADQVRSIDWKARRASKAGVAPEQTIAEVLARALTLFS